MKPGKQLSHRSRLVRSGNFKRGEDLTTGGDNAENWHSRRGLVVNGRQDTAVAIMQDLQLLDGDLFHGHTEIFTAAAENEVLSWPPGSSLRKILLI